MFRDRKDAGKKLAKALVSYRDKDVLILAIPRGGAEVGYEVAESLNAEFSLIVTRKLPFPDNPEAGFGAVAEDGSMYVFDYYSKMLDDEVIERIIEDEKQECQRRVDVLRKGKPLPEIKERTVIIIDDGIAMGSTMRASIELCKKRKAGKIIVAVPVTGSDRAHEIGKLVDEIYVLETPAFFQAVAQIYENWYDVPDSEVIQLMEKWRQKRK